MGDLGLDGPKRSHPATPEIPHEKRSTRGKCALQELVFVARTAVGVVAWTIYDSMCGDDDGIYIPGIAWMCPPFVSYFNT